MQEKARQAVFDTLPPIDGEAADNTPLPLPSIVPVQAEEFLVQFPPEESLLPPSLPLRAPTGEELYVLNEYFTRNYVHINGVGKREWSDTKSDGLYTFYHHAAGKKVLTMKLALPLDHWLVQETVKLRRRDVGVCEPRTRYTYTTATWKVWGDFWPKRCNIYLSPHSALYRRLYNLAEELIAVCPEPHWRRRP